MSISSDFPTDLPLDITQSSPEMVFLNNHAIIISIIIVLVYFLPFAIACLRGHRQMPAIFVLNVFAGWTFMGWVGALIWSVIRSPSKD
jgi:hypothetical protein